MEYLQTLLASTETPFLAAILMGLMTAVSPCPLATNITATAYISKDIQNKRIIFRNGLIYTLGRAISYTGLGVILFFGASKFRISGFFNTYGERFLGFLLIIIGVFMIDLIKLNLSGGNLMNKLSEKIKGGNALSALLLGVIFALAFCPYSGMIYFGMLIPITVSSASGLWLPLAFAVATGLPVIIIAYILAYTVSGIGTFYKSMRKFEFWFRRIVGALFILVGIYYLVIFYV